MKKSLLLILVIYLMIPSGKLSAQCNFLTTAVESGDTLHCSGGDFYRTAVTYNPQFSFYYSVNAGGTAAEEVFDINGDLLYSSTVADWRGLWWNPNINRVEGNAWGNYFFIDSLQANGYLGGNHSLIASTNPPDVQSAGAYDPTGNMIYYYYNGMIYGESRADFVDITPFALTGLPNFSNMVSYAVIYTGCPGSELGIYDAAAEILYLFDKTTGALGTTIVFPSTAVDLSYLGGNFSYANNIVWLYSLPLNKWIGYDIFGPAGVEEAEEQSLEIYPNPVNSLLSVKAEKPEMITIVNLVGEVMMTKEIQTETQIDLSDFPVGIYFIKTENGRAQKFVKQ